MLEKPERRQIEDLNKTRPDFTLTAGQYDAEFEADKDAAARKYRGKVVELTGVVGGHIGMKEDQPCIELEGAENTPEWNASLPIRNPGSNMRSGRRSSSKEGKAGRRPNLCLSIAPCWRRPRILPFD